MISQILEILKSAKTPISLDGLYQQMAVERSALEGMLNHLVQKGKIQKISPSNTDPGKNKGAFLCEGCQSSSYCSDLIKAPVYYTLNQSRK